MSNGLYPDQARYFVRPDKGQNCLQKMHALADKEARFIR